MNSMVQIIFGRRYLRNDNLNFLIHNKSKEMLLMSCITNDDFICIELLENYAIKIKLPSYKNILLYYAASEIENHAFGTNLV